MKRYVGEKPATDPAPTVPAEPAVPAVIDASHGPGKTSSNKVTARDLTPTQVAAARRWYNNGAYGDTSKVTLAKALQLYAEEMEQEGLIERKK